MMNSTSKTGMSEAAKEAKRAYLRDWREKNKQRSKEYQQRYWEKKAAEAARTNMQYSTGKG